MISIQRIKRFLPIALILAGVLLRFYRLGLIPYGLNNDEASIGYDAFALATYGIDRNGYPWPVYPITWGSGGGGPMVVYLSVLTEKLIGHSIFSLRLPSAIFGSIALPLFYLLLKRAFDRPAAVAGLALLAFNPWHLLMSRFTLDCNTIAFWLILALLLFVYGADSSKTGYFIACAVVFGLCLYVYGASTIVIPVFLLLVALYAVKHGMLRFRQLIFSICAFLITILPLIVFYAINFLDLPAIVTPVFSIPRFITSRSVFYGFGPGLLNGMKESLLYLLRFLSIGPVDTEVICNQVPGFGVFYRFTFPLTILGLIASVRKIKKKPDLLCAGTLILFTCIFIFSLFLRLEISRVSLFLVPVLILQAIAMQEILNHAGRTVYLLALLILFCGMILFARNYFGRRYATASAENFMPGYGEAVLYADSLHRGDQTIYSTYRHLAAPFAVALYYTETPVQDFIDTVEYRDEVSEARIAIRFTHFVFGLPEDIHDERYRNDILILHEEDLNEFSAEDYSITQFEKFLVAVRK